MQGMDEQNQTPFTYTPNTASEAPSSFDEPRSVPLPKIPEVSWSASEYIAHEKAPSWYAGVFAAAVALVAVIYLITRDTFASITVFIASIILLIYAGRKPRIKNYTVSENGISVGEKTFSYGEFRSFSVVSEDAINSIWLKPLKRFAPVVVMYFSPEDEQKIIDTLANFLPHEDRELDVIDRFSKRIRF
jgi:hypothetical protein